MTTLLTNQNIPLAFANNLSPLLYDIFPDSKIAKKYASAATKTTCMINSSIAPYFQRELVSVMKSDPYSLHTDGSNDVSLDKMNPVTVRIFDINSGKVESRFLDMCATKGTDSATAAAIFNKIDEVVMSCNISWSNCVGFGVDNTSVNVGIRNSIYTRVIQKNPACYFMGCPCHLMHNVACRASSAFSAVSGFDIEDMCVDVYHYFDKSTKRKSTLVQFAQFCDVKYRQVIKQVSTRWLSLEVAVKRSLQMYPALKSYFLSSSEAQARFKRLKNHFHDPMVEIYLQFYHAVLPTFTIVNLFLQREDPCIFAVYKQLRNFVKRLLGKFVSIQCIREAEHIGCTV